MILRRLFAIAILAAFALPLILPVITAAANPPAWEAWLEGWRLGLLFLNSIALAALTCCFAVPLGIAISFGLFASDLPGRRFALPLFAIALAVPLPILTIAGSLFGTNLTGPWNQFGSGIFQAACIHAWAALPWIVLIVGPAFAGETAIDDDIRVHAPGIVRAQLALRAAKRAILIAVIWVIVQTTGEIIVSDVAQVRTFGEEVYTQFVSPGVSNSTSAELALARAVFISAPLPLLLAIGLFWIVRKEWLDETSGQQMAGPGFTFGRLNWLLGGILLVIAVVLLGLPVIGLGIRASAGRGFMAAIAATLRASQENAAILLASSVGAAIVGIAVTAFAMICCLAARRQPRLRAPLAAIALFAATTPGPVLGVGVLAAIGWLIEQEEKLGSNLLANALYYQSSPLPVWWVHAVRGFPMALAVLWPTVRTLPRGFQDATQLETASKSAHFRNDVLPYCARAAIASTLLVAAVSLGEVSASKIVATANGQTFAHDLFSRMHFGITPELAGMALALFAIVGLAGLILAWVMSHSASSTATPSRAL